MANDKPHQPEPQTQSRSTLQTTMRTATRPETHEVIFSFSEVASHLNISNESLLRLSRRFGRHLGEHADEDEPAFTNTDVAALVTVQKLLAQGYQDEEIDQFLAPVPVEIDGTALTALPGSVLRTSDQSEDGVTLSKAVSDVLNTIVTSQQAVLNGQSTVRDMVGVVAQDNFNLKDENRKLRDRMLELERALAEYQRREEIRKERTESRVRALEGTVAALQQQVAQLVQLHRQQRRRRGFFG